METSWRWRLARDWKRRCTSLYPPYPFTGHQHPAIRPSLKQEPRDYFNVQVLIHEKALFIIDVVDVITAFTVRSCVCAKLGALHHGRDVTADVFEILHYEDAVHAILGGRLGWATSVIFNFQDGLRGVTVLKNANQLHQ